MSVSGAMRALLVSVGLLAWGGLALGEGAKPTFPPGKDFSSPKPAKNPRAPLTPWKAVVARDDPAVYKGPTGDELLTDAKAKFGDLTFVVASQAIPGKPDRLLLGKFDPESEEFKGWLGWVEASFVLDDPLPLKVKAAREQLLKTVPKDHPFYERIQLSMPDASRPDFENVTLKAVTHPERGKACFPRPVPAAEYEKMSKTPAAVPLQPFAFFYVYRVAVDPKGVHCLLGPRSDVNLEADSLGDKFRQQVVGWVDIDSLILWTTREAFEYSLERAPLESRRKTKKPIELYARKNDLMDWAQWEMDGRKGEPRVKPVYSEELDPAKAPAWMQKPWNPLWMRYPILASFPLPQKGPRPPAGIDGKWLGYQLCILGSTKEGGGASAADVEAMKKRLNDAVKDLRVFELVIVLDTTGSMSIVFGPVKEAVVKMVEDLKVEAASHKDELEKIQLRVAVVLYKDHPAQDSEYLTKATDDFFDVMTDKGLADFKEWLGDKASEAKGGGDELEEPFYGIDKAVEKFLALEGSKHLPGAARVVMVIGDSGNHEVGGDTKLSRDDVLKSLDPVGEAVIDKQKKELAKIQLHSVMTLLTTEDLKKDREGLRKWEAQIHYLADKTGGTKHEVTFHDADAKRTSTEKMTAALKTALASRRALMREELTKIRDRFGVTGEGGDAAATSGAALVIAKDRLREVIKGKDELENLMKGLSKAFFTEVYTVEQIPNESEELARLKLCILTSEKEFLKILAATQAMAEGLDEIVKKGGLAGSGDVVEAKIKRLIIQTMLSAFGEEATPGRIEALMKKTLPQIQKEVNQLPVQFGILKTQPKNEEELKKMVSTLKVKAAKLFEINGTHRNARFFAAGVATGENHIWLYKSELP